MNIYLIGFMATGKSSVGRALGLLLDREFVDLDAYIEAKAGRKITEIFALAGEPFFRTLESEVLAEISQKKDLIVACGGGIVTVPGNIRLMKETGKVLCLTASVDEILKRAEGSSERPLLDLDNRPQKVIALMAQRASLYRAAADMILDTTGLEVNEVTEAAARFCAQAQE